jgi:hypothetical protein
MPHLLVDFGLRIGDRYADRVESVCVTGRGRKEE